MKDEEHNFLNETIEEHKVKFDMNDYLIDVNTRNDEEHARASRSPSQNTTKAEYHRLLVFLFHFPFNLDNIS